MQQNKTTLVQSPFTTLGQETRWGLFSNASELTQGCSDNTVLYSIKVGYRGYGKLYNRFGSLHQTLQSP